MIFQYGWELRILIFFGAILEKYNMVSGRVGADTFLAGYRISGPILVSGNPVEFISTLNIL